MPHNLMEGLEAVQLDDPGYDSAVNFPPLQLSEMESQILELYDRLEEIQLEISFLEAQENVPNGKMLFPVHLAARKRILILYRSISCCI